MDKYTQKIKIKAMCVVIRKGNQILATIGRDEVKGEDFGRIIGGSMEFGETAEVALRREFQEELNTSLQNLVFLNVVENIFTYNGRLCHEIVFMHKASLADKNLYDKEHIQILDDRAQAIWIPLDDVFAGRIKLYPEFDYQALMTKT